MSLILYFVFAYALLAALTGMILQISRKMGDCPDTGRVARAAGVTISTGFAASGAGGAMLVGSALRGPAGPQCQPFASKERKLLL